MISPDIHITITIGQEVVQTVASTIGFVFACWCIVKIIEFGLKNDKEQT